MKLNETIICQHFAFISSMDLMGLLGLGLLGLGLLGLGLAELGHQQRVMEGRQELLEVLVNLFP
tara:strand:+ start:66 stop:257 length:192 start_codon:yes stop_codon:yes gene_type:complete